LSNSVKPKNKITRQFYRITGTALVLFLLGSALLFLLFGEQLVKKMKEEINILVEIEGDADSEEVSIPREKLASLTQIKKGSIQYIPKDEAARRLQEDFGEDFIRLDMPNPLFDVLNFNLKAQYTTSNEVKSFVDKLIELPSVRDVHYQEGLVDQLEQNIEKVGYTGLGIAFLFLFIGMVLIHSTVRLSLISNRFIIKNMQLVGASWGFISRPYLWQSVRSGLWSGILAALLLLLLIWALYQQLPGVIPALDSTTISLLFIGLILLGICINFLSTWYVVNKYLRMRVDDLY